MGWNIQPFEDFSLKKITTLGADIAGFDGTGIMSNLNRTLPIQVFGRPFTIIFEGLLPPATAAGGQDIINHVKVQVNNKAYTDPSKKYHNATPLDYGRETIRQGMEAAGVVGQLETSLTASDFDVAWVDYPGLLPTQITNTAPTFEGGPGWRWVRIVGCTDDGTDTGDDDATTPAPIQLVDQMEAFLYHGGADHTGK